MKLEDASADRTPRKSNKRVLTDDNSVNVVEWRKEIDEYLLEMQDFSNMEVDEIFMALSAYTSRVSYIRTQIMRSSSRLLQGFRTGEIDPFISECDRQFKFWSRVQSVNQMDWNASRNVT